MSNHFYAMLFRMKYIERWALMRNTVKENLSEHSMETAFIAHAIAVIENKRFGGSVNAERAALVALFHDVPEIITGDLPTPVKYYNENIKEAYNQMENAAKDEFLSLLPNDLYDEYDKIFNETDEQILKIVKAADKIAALIKCRTELSMGNKEFLLAEKSTEKIINDINMPAAKVFLDEYLESFSLSLDELKSNPT